MVMKSYLAFLVVISLIIVVAPSSKVEDPMVKEGRSGSASVLMAGYEQVSDFELLFENVAAAYLRPGWEDIDVARFTLTVSEDAQAPVRMRGFTFTIDGINSKTFTNFVMTYDGREYEGSKNVDEVVFDGFHDKIWPGESIDFVIVADVASNARIGDRLHLVIDRASDIDISMKGEPVVSSQDYPLGGEVLSVIGRHAFYRLD